jgi:hypothetical protein
MELPFAMCPAGPAVFFPERAGAFGLGVLGGTSNPSVLIRCDAWALS